MNQRGLGQILEKIRTAASPTLVSRYLSLIADLSDEPHKQSCALDLAEVLVDADAAQALSIAHMVYKSDRRNLRALDIMIAAMKAKGRFAKAEVLQVERDKIAQVAPDAAAVARPAARALAPSPRAAASP